MLRYIGSSQAQGQADKSTSTAEAIASQALIGRLVLDNHAGSPAFWSAHDCLQKRANSLRKSFS